ncbi:MAG: hypothetical protein GWP09_03085, partial [Nitrospiraceae bacterium]|nr:hypothetical protein [Nitrospiraceae bacterium]
EPVSQPTQAQATDYQPVSTIYETPEQKLLKKPNEPVSQPTQAQATDYQPVSTIYETPEQKLLKKPNEPVSQPQHATAPIPKINKNQVLNQLKQKQTNLNNQYTITKTTKPININNAPTTEEQNQRQMFKTETALSQYPTAPTESMSNNIKTPKSNIKYQPKIKNQNSQSLWTTPINVNRVTKNIKNKNLKIATNEILTNTNAVVSEAKGFGHGFIDTLIAPVIFGANMVTHPTKTVKQTVKTIAHPYQTVNALSDYITEKRNKNGEAYNLMNDLGYSIGIQEGFLASDYLYSKATQGAHKIIRNKITAPLERRSKNFRGIQYNNGKKLVGKTNKEIVNQGWVTASDEGATWGEYTTGREKGMQTPVERVNTLKQFELLNDNMNINPKNVKLNLKNIKIGSTHTTANPTVSKWAQKGEKPLILMGGKTNPTRTANNLRNFYTAPDYPILNNEQKAERILENIYSGYAYSSKPYNPENIEFALKKPTPVTLHIKNKVEIPKPRPHESVKQLTNRVLGGTKNTGKTTVAPESMTGYNQIQQFTSTSWFQGSDNTNFYGSVLTKPKYKGFTQLEIPMSPNKLNKLIENKMGISIGSQIKFLNKIGLGKTNVKVKQYETTLPPASPLKSMPQMNVDLKDLTLWKYRGNGRPPVEPIKQPKTMPTKPDKYTSKNFLKQWQDYFHFNKKEIKKINVKKPMPKAKSIVNKPNIINLNKYSYGTDIKYITPAHLLSSGKTLTAFGMLDSMMNALRSSKYSKKNRPQTNKKKEYNFNFLTSPLGRFGEQTLSFQQWQKKYGKKTNQGQSNSYSLINSLFGKSSQKNKQSNHQSKPTNNNQQGGGSSQSSGSSSSTTYNYYNSY